MHFLEKVKPSSDPPTKSSNKVETKLREEKTNQQNKPKILHIFMYQKKKKGKQIMPINLDSEFASTYMLNSC